jgi:hypothetical protein
LILSILSLPYSFWNIAQQNRYARRQKVIAQLQHEGGRHLIIVRYAADVSNSVEWVYNQADIDNAQIVWARETTTTEDRVLMNYFKDRRVWLLRIDKHQTQLLPYAFSADSQFPDSRSSSLSRAHEKSDNDVLPTGLLTIS